MNPSIETRELIAVDIGGNRLWGTIHRPGRDQSTLVPDEKNRVGILFLNSGVLPRASPSAVYWAESFASCGYTAIRFDLPGLGDSQGNIPEKMFDFVSAAGYAPDLAAALKDVVERCDLSGVVIMGQCAGAVTALFTAAVSEECKGVVLMDPFFHVPQERLRIRDELSRWSAASGPWTFAGEVYHRLRHLGRVISGNKLPKNANLPLLRCWRQVTSGRKPVLILKAPGLKTRGAKPRVGEFDYLEYLRRVAGGGADVSVKVIEGTNHSFADTAGRQGVREATERWLNHFFPLPIPVEPQEAPVMESALETASTAGLVLPGLRS